MEKAGLVRPAFSEFGSGPTGGPETMTTSNLNVAHSSDGVSSQLNLPSGPLGLVRPRRERTDADRDWYSEQLAVPHVKLIDKSVYERLAFYGSLNPERTAFPAVKRLAREALCSERSVRYALRRLESSGLVECVSPGCGRSTSRYRIVGSSDCRADLQTVQVRPAPAEHVNNFETLASCI